MPINVIFACPKCGSLYIAAHHAWSGAYDYPIWRPHEPLGARLVVQHCRRLRDGSGVVHEDRYICRPVQRQDVGEFAEEVVTPPPLRLPMAPALIFASKICTVTLKQL
jgi:hypothetical protein